MNIPQNVALEQLKQEIAKLLNYGISEYNIPLYAIEYMLKDFLSEVHTQATIEYEQAVKALNEQAAKEKAASEPTDEAPVEETTEA